jgi:hypothetical protein
MSVAAFISSQRTMHGVPHAVTCRALGVSQSWFYKWHGRQPSPRQQRRQELADAIRAVETSKNPSPSPRVISGRSAHRIKRCGQCSMVGTLSAVRCPLPIT